MIWNRRLAGALALTLGLVAVTGLTAQSFLGRLSSDRLLGRDTAGEGAVEQLGVSAPVAFTGSGGIGLNGSTAEFNTALNDGDFATLAGTETLSGKTFSGSTLTGAHDGGGASSFEIPNSATPTVDADGEIALDTSVSDWSHGIFVGYGGEAQGFVTMPIGEWTAPTDGYVVTYNATNDELELAEAPGASGGIADIVEDLTPQLGGQLDVNGFAIGDGTRELLSFVEDGSAVNQVEIENQATGGGPIVRPAGDDTNINLVLAGKGTGAPQASALILPEGSAQATGSGQGAIYTKDSGTQPELYYREESSGDEVRVTRNGLVSGETILTAEQATTSGRSITFSSIPSSVRWITVLFNDVSANGTTDAIYVRIGDAGGIESTGYLGAVINSPGSTTVAYSTGFTINHANVAAATYSGIVRLYLQDASDFTWVMDSQIIRTDNNGASQGIGTKALSEELTQLQIGLYGSTNDFDGGSASIQYGY